MSLASSATRGSCWAGQGPGGYGPPGGQGPGGRIHIRGGFVPTGNVTEKFLAALDDIRRTALSCDYAIPPPTSGEIDYDAVNVTFREGAAKAETFYYVGTADDCKLSASGAWYFDDPKKPTKVVLCPHTCERVSAAADGKMAVAFGCKRNDIK